MCLIIAKPNSTGISLPAEYIENAAINNPHGFGLIGKLPDGSIYTAKTMDMQESLGIVRDFEREHADIVCHFRYATHGKKNEDNCHPFRLGKTENYLVHNGVLPIEIENEAMSDTWHFAERLNRKLKRKGYTRRQVRRFMYARWGMISTSKFVIMGEDIPMTIVNEKLGVMRKGVWYSNEYSLKSRYISYSKTNSSDWLSQFDALNGTISEPTSEDDCEMCGNELTETEWER